MQSLFLHAKQDSGIHPAALQIFRASLETEQDPWAAARAAQGIEYIAGPDEARTTWLALLNHPRAEIVTQATWAINDASYVSTLIELLQRRPEVPIHIAAIRTLGRLRDSAAFPTIVEHLASPELRPDAIEALSDLGDMRAIPHLEPLLDDTTDSRKVDDRGAMLLVCVLANDALRRLRADEKRRNTVGASEVIRQTSSHEIAVAEPLPTLSTQPPRNLAAYLPLVAAMAEISWIAAVIIGQLFTTGTVTRNPAETHRLDLIAMIPALAGLLTGLVVIARGRTYRLAERICLCLGCIGCGLFIFSFGWEFFH